MIAGRDITVRTRPSRGYYEAEMNQGSPALDSPLTGQAAARFAGALGLSPDDLHRLPMQVVSTGLPYLIVPLASGLDRAHITVADFEERLASVGAKFVYVFDPAKREGRSWDNAGAVEDVATGSARPARPPPGSLPMGWPHPAKRSSSTRDGSSAGRA